MGLFTSTVSLLLHYYIYFLITIDLKNPRRIWCLNIMIIMTIIGRIHSLPYVFGFVYLDRYA